MTISHRAITYTLLILLTCGVVPALAGDPTQRAGELRKLGVEPDRKGVEAFLDSLRLSPEREAKIRSLLADLGNDKYSVREKATSALLSLPPIPLQLLKEAANNNAETRDRVQRILAKPAYAEANAKLLAVYRFIEAENVKGLTPIILDLMLLWDDSSLIAAACQAMPASATPADAGQLRKAIVDSSSERIRAASVVALASALQEQATKDLETLLSDKSDEVRLEAAFALVNQGNHAGLRTLIALLESESPQMRQTAAMLLKSATSHNVAFASYDEPQKRADAVAAWRTWFEKEGAVAKLNLPISKRAAFRGKILIGAWADKQLRDMDIATGKVIFEKGNFGYLWGCHATPEGSALAVDYTSHSVVEFDAQGKQIWRQQLQGGPTSVERLANGRTLITLAEPGIVVEIDMKGEVVWKTPHLGRPTTAQRLVNGNTLICLQDGNRVIEVDANGATVWELTGLRTPHTAQGLENGNVLVCEFGNQAAQGGVREFDRAGKVVWTAKLAVGTAKTPITNPAQAQRLPNGNTLISGNEGIFEMDSDSRQVRHIIVSRSKFFAY